MSDHNTVGIRLYEATAADARKYKALADERAAQVARLEADNARLRKRIAYVKLTNAMLRRRLIADRAHPWPRNTQILVDGDRWVDAATWPAFDATKTYKIRFGGRSSR